MKTTQKLAMTGMLAAVFALAACDMSTSRDDMDEGEGMPNEGMQNGGMDGGGQQEQGGG